MMRLDSGASRLTRRRLCGSHWKRSGQVSSRFCGSSIEQRNACRQTGVHQGPQGKSAGQDWQWRAERTITAGETKKLETKEAGLNKEESNMRKADDGHLSAADRAKLNQQQNHLSKQIYTDKHNANKAHYGNNEVGQRRENQQDRIAQGIKSGQLTPSETAHIEKTNRE
jgi:hypothetical protein